MFKSNEELIKYLKISGVLKSSLIENALRKVDRVGFVRDELKDEAYFDQPLRIAENQTISQPTTVAIMLEMLDVKSGQKVLDIGAGSGWVSCLLGELVGGSGEVLAFEINEKVGKIGQKNVKNFGAKNVRYVVGDAGKHWGKNESFDRIYSGAGFDEIPEDLKKQLGVGGVLVAPTQDGFMRKITRIGEDELSEEKQFGFSFVPFV